MRCGRRNDLFAVNLNDGADPDQWHEDNTCSYCGSMSPEDFFKAIEDGKTLTPTDKGYKVYVEGSKKFYFQHLSGEQRLQFIDLWNAGKMKLAYPGYFYTMPYFCRQI